MLERLDQGPNDDLRLYNGNGIIWNLKKLPLSRKHVSLEFFYRDTTDDVRRIISSIPRHIIHLDLSRNWFLKYRSLEELTLLISALPRNLYSINLSFNKFNYAQFIAVLRNLPSGLSSLDLIRSGLEDRTKEEIKSIAEAIPADIHFLSIAGCYFGFEPKEKLIMLLKSLPKRIQSLDFSALGLYGKSPEELINIFKFIPSHVTSLNIDETFFGMRPPHPEYLFSVLKNLPITIKNVFLNKNEFSELSNDYLQELVLSPFGLTKVIFTRDTFSPNPILDEVLPDNLCAKEKLMIDLHLLFNEVRLIDILGAFLGTNAFYDPIIKNNPLFFQSIPQAKQKPAPSAPCCVIS